MQPSNDEEIFVTAINLAEKRHMTGVWNPKVDSTPQHIADRFMADDGQRIIPDLIVARRHNVNEHEVWWLGVDYFDNTASISGIVTLIQNYLANDPDERAIIEALGVLNGIKAEKLPAYQDRYGLTFGDTPPARLAK